MIGVLEIENLQQNLDLTYRTLGLVFFICLLVVLSIALVLLFFNDNRSFMTGVLASGVFVSIGIIIASFLVNYRNSIRKFEALGSSDATLEASNETFSMSSHLGVVTLPWSAIEKVWKNKDFYLLIFTNGSYSILPTAKSNEQFQQFFLEQVQKFGGKIS